MHIVLRSQRCLSNIKYCNFLYNSYVTPSGTHQRGTLVQDLKYRFRIKAAQKPDLYDTAQGVSSLSRVSVEDVRNIWLHRLIAETGLPSYKVNIPNEIVYDMENILKEKMPRDEEKCIQFEDFLPTLVFLIKAEVTAEDEEEMVKELLEFWNHNSNNRCVDDVELREKAISTVRRVRDMVCQ